VVLSWAALDLHLEVLWQDVKLASSVKSRALKLDETFVGHTDEATCLVKVLSNAQPPPPAHHTVLFHQLCALDAVTGFGLQPQPNSARTSCPPLPVNSFITFFPYR
jgi:hypothetical protein